MLDKLFDRLNEKFPATDEKGRMRDATENYFVGSLPYIVLLLFMLPLVIISLLLNGDTIVVTLMGTLVVIVSWVANVIGIKNHRETSDYHRNYMEKHLKRMNKYRNHMNS